MIREALIRARVRVHRARLDAALAEGEDPWSSVELMARGAQLAALEERQRVADSFCAAVDIVDHGWASMPGIGLRRLVVQPHREFFLAIARRLREPAPVPVPVVARARQLVRDRKSPLYLGGRPASSLNRELTEIAFGLLAEHTTTDDLRTTNVDL